MTENEQEKPQEIEAKPVDEVSGFYFSSNLKIFDPNSKEVLVQMRGDE